MVSEADVYAVVGEDGFARLTAAFYRRVPGDSVLGPMYAGVDLAAAERRLRLFLVGRFNGPATYVQERGHPRLRMRHAAFRIDPAAAGRWLTLMGEAMAETALPPAVEPVLWAYFQSTAAHMVNHAG